MRCLARPGCPAQTEYAVIAPLAKRARRDALTDHQQDVAERQRRGALALGVVGFAQRVGVHIAVPGRVRLPATRVFIAAGTLAGRSLTQYLLQQRFTPEGQLI